jgi:DNA-directed RNA polymerase subunit M/transcription elongation factor TFIIS
MNIQKDPPRIKIINLIKNTCSAYQDFVNYPETKQFDVAISIEKGIYNKTIMMCSKDEDAVVKVWENKEFMEIYSGEVYRVVYNIDPETNYNSNIMDDVFDYIDLAKGLNPVLLADKSTQELNPDASKKILEEILAQKEIKEFEVVSTLYECGKCHKRISIYKPVQLRRADEETSISYKCVFCGNSWVVI